MQAGFAAFMRLRFADVCVLLKLARAKLFPILLKNDNKPDKCLNCGHVFAGGGSNNFCPDCGQKNVGKDISFFQIAGEFIATLFSMDSKLMHTIPPLLFKPGSVTKNFLDGKRVRYFPPFRLYLVASVLYFALLNIFVVKDAITNSPNLNVATEESDTTGILDLNLNFVNDTTSNAKLNDALERIMELAKKYEPDVVLDSLQVENNYLVQGWFGKHMVRQGIKMYQTRGQAWFSYLLRNLSIFIIFLMPLAALVFKSLYAFSGRYYLQHLIFHLHYHAFLYLLLSLLILAITYFSGVFGVLLGVYAILYLYFAMRKVYGQGKIWTSFKWLAFLTIYPVIIGLFAILAIGISILLF